MPLLCEGWLAESRAEGGAAATAVAAGMPQAQMAASVWDERRGCRGRRCVVGLIMINNVLNAVSLSVCLNVG